MKFIHISDLHLGKRLNEFSLIEDQKYILKRILNIIDTSSADAVLISGDVYDKSVPSVEAVELFDDFITQISLKRINCFIISGNHDSAERIAFGGRLMRESGVFLSPVYSGNVEPIVLSDSYGEINVYMLPFIKPANVRRFFPDAENSGYDDAVRLAVSEMNVDATKRNIILSHQFVTGAEKSDSEEVSVGGSDNISSDIFDSFEYVALGHIHRSQSMTRKTVRYCGTPLKYSFSEVNHIKSVTVVELKEKGNVIVDEIPLKPLRELRELKGKFEELMSPLTYEGTSLKEDYLRIILTDEIEVIDAIGKLRTVYKNIMRIEYDNTRTRSYKEITNEEDCGGLSPLEYFAGLYEMQNNVALSSEETEFMSGIIDRVSLGEVDM